METKELVKSENSLTLNVFADKQAFEHIQRVAKVFSASDITPARYKGNEANCIIALEIAGRIGASPLMVMQNLDIIQGKPGWSSQFLIASLNASGKFSPLRYEEDEEEGGRTRAWAIDKNSNEKLFGIWVSMKMAEEEGWSKRSGSKWKTMAQLMRRYRAASFFVKQFAPEISMGIQSIEEVVDITPLQEAVVVNKEDERALALLNACTTIEDLNELEKSLPEKYKEQVTAKRQELRKEKISTVAQQA